MLRYIFIFLCVNFCHLSASDPIQIETQAVKKESMPIEGEDNFVVYYVFADKVLEKPLKEIMVTFLRKLGPVYPGDDSKFSNCVRLEVPLEIVNSKKDFSFCSMKI